MIVTYEGLHKDDSKAAVKADDFNHVAYFMQNLGVCFNLLFTRTAEGKLKEHEKTV